MIKNFEKDMADALDQMRSEKERASIEISTLKAQVICFKEDGFIFS